MRKKVRKPDEHKCIAAAVDRLDAEETPDGDYRYYADETSEWYLVSRQEVIELGEMLLADEPGAYSLWCAYAGRPEP